MPIKTSNHNARQYVQRGEEFIGNNTFARLLKPYDLCLTHRYVVYSYGEHFPLRCGWWRARSHRGTLVSPSGDHQLKFRSGRA